MALNPNAKEFRPGRTFQHEETLRERLEEQLRNETYECMICCEKIRRRDFIWSCQQCFHVFHLKCVRKWAKSSTTQDENTSQNLNIGWRCPGCQNVNTITNLESFCFCLREKLLYENSRASMYRTPHSCGKMCKRIRDRDPHPCPLLCHPGPCPPCPKTVEKFCVCGSLSKFVRCGTEDFKCQKKCDKILNCEIHICTLICHNGQCPNCDQTVQTVCHCGKNSRTDPCSFDTLSFACEEPYGKLMSCRNHFCAQKCHPGPCPECLFSPQVTKTCPCGKKDLRSLSVSPRKSCLDPWATCGQVCGKILPCGPEDNRHTCKALCHSDPTCPPCDLKTKVQCRCKSFMGLVSCSKLAGVDETHPYLCDKPCGKKKNCQTHKCREMCCSQKEHICMQICGKKLNCNIHTCDQLCHKGKCRPCPVVSFDELNCYCGAAVIYPPVPCGTRPPPCLRLCTREHPCGHPVAHNCHSDPQCPPCSFLTSKMCYGGHEMRRNIPCYLNDVSCGKPCSKVLPCGRHKCTKICHKGECSNGAAFVCKQPCDTPRPGCSHPCGARCHPDADCPMTPCDFPVPITCKCGRLSGTKRCKDDEKSKSLPCDMECDREQRNKRLAEALGCQYRRYNEENCDTSPIYTDFLKSQYKISGDFIQNLEKIFAQLIETVNSSKITQTKSHIFPPMKSESRKIIHEFAAFYNIETVSYDTEPLRNVVATATKGKSRVPLVLLSSFCKNLEPRKCQTAPRMAAPVILPEENPSESIKMQSLTLMQAESEKF